MKILKALLVGGFAIGFSVIDTLFVFHFEEHIWSFPLGILLVFPACVVFVELGNWAERSENKKEK